MSRVTVNLHSIEGWPSPRARPADHPHGSFPLDRPPSDDRQALPRDGPVDPKGQTQSFAVTLRAAVARAELVVGTRTDLLPQPNLLRRTDVSRVHRALRRHLLIQTLEHCLGIHSG